MAERAFGPYRLVRQIAVGGMAEIHLAKTRGIAGFEKFVALKMIHPNFAQDEQFIQMLIDEAKIAVQLQHVNIAQTFDLGRVGETYYITMEYVDGADLYKILRRGSEQDLDMPLDVCAFVAKEAATGLDHAHRKRDVTGVPLGIVHRDVSPQNVLISHAGEVKLVDFGIAKATMRARQTQVGVIKGKYYYMSPEQAWGDPLDHRSDIFSCGIVLYEMMTGQMLYLEEDLHKLLDMVRRADIAPPTRLRRDVPPQLERIAMHALAKNPGDRYQSAADFAADLERFLHTYSPVFTASKLAAHLRKAVGEQMPIVEPSGPAPVRSPHQQTLELVNDRSEIADENSVIFRMDELRARDSARTQSDDVSTATELPRKVGRAGLADIEEMTSVSAPPQFATQPAAGLDYGDYEPTMIESGPPGSHAEEASDSEDGPTTTRDGLGVPLPQPVQLSSSETAPRPSAEIRSKLRPPTAHPALAASTPTPAVSAVRGAPKSRRTPPGGVPVVPPAPPRRPQNTTARNILQGIIKAQPGDPMPTVQMRQAPVSSDGVPTLPDASVPTGGATHPYGPPGQVGPPATVPGPMIPSGPLGTQPAIPGQHAVPTPYAPPMPTPPQVQRVPTPPPMPMPPPRPSTAQPPPLVAPPTPAPGTMPAAQLPPHLVNYDGTYSLPHSAQTVQPGYPYPYGQPQMSFTKQMQAAIELDELPQRYKLQENRGRRILVIAAVAAVFIGAIGVTVMVMRGDEPPPKASLTIESTPPGARVTVDGVELGTATPAVFETKPGARHEIDVMAPHFKPWHRTVVVPSTGGDVRVPALLDASTGKLRINSQPGGAEIWINNELRGLTPRTLEGIDTTTATAVELRLKDFPVETRPLDWSRGDTIDLDVKFRR